MDECFPRHNCFKCSEGPRHNCFWVCNQQHAAWGISDMASYMGQHLLRQVQILLIGVYATLMSQSAWCRQPYTWGKPSAGRMCLATAKLAMSSIAKRCLCVLLQTDLTHPMARLDLAASSLFMFDSWMNCRAAYVGKLRNCGLGTSSCCCCWSVG